MSTALLRRAPDCASDLTIDRWLLGELGQAGEARRLEEHLQRCTQCGSRVRSLRALYGHQRSPHRGLKVAPRVAPPPAPKLGQHGVAQVILLRDGLLVGTEVFTPGEWLVGSDPRCDLVLADASVSPRHARLVFRAGRAAIEALEGGLFVNGFTVTTAELRPIDELSCGPYVLRTRVIADRWKADEARAIAQLRPVAPLGVAPLPEVTQPGRRALEAAQEAVTAPGAPGPHAAPPPQARLEPAPATPSAPGSALQLELKLFWGGACQVARAFGAGEVLADERETAAMPLWGFGLERAVKLAEGDGRRFRLFVPPGARAERLGPKGWEPLPAAPSVALDGAAAVRLVRGALALVATVAPAPAQVAPRALSPRALLVPLSSAVLFAALLLTMRVFAVEEDDFVPRALPRAVVKMTLPPKPPPPAKPVAVDKEQVARAPARPARTRAPAVRRSQAPAPPPIAAVAALQKSSLDAIGRALDEVGAKGRRAAAGPGALALPTLGKSGAALGFSAHGGPGIGANGLRGAGQLSTGGLGAGAVGGQLDRAVSRKVGAPPSGIDKDKVARVINEHLAEVQRCYEQALLAHQGLQGRATLEWVITTDGTVKSARTKSSTLKSPLVESCILAKLKRWPFPKARGGDVAVSYPFVFDAVAF